MKFDRIRLSNFKCYADAALRLQAGVTVIHGRNGSGKSSLLEACFFALYGARALESTLDEVVTIGADDAEVEVWFTHGGDEYHVDRRVRATGEQATTARCVLETPETTVEGARNVRRYVEELLRMGASAFVNCAYVRQGEVNELINASPSQRQDVIDSLLQLGKLEEYRDRASDARVGVDRVRENKQGALSGLEDQIAAKEDAGLQERLNALESELAEVTAEVEDLDEQRETAVQTRDRAVEVLEACEERREELDELEDDIEDLREQVAETEREREDLADEVESVRDRRKERATDLAETLAETELDADDPDDVDTETVDRRIDRLETEDDEIQGSITDASVEKNRHEERASTHREQAEELEREATENREAATDLETELEEGRRTLADRREKLDAIDEERDELRAEFDDIVADLAVDVAFGEADSLRESVTQRHDEAVEAVAGLEADVGKQREAVAEVEALLDEGKCPECGQDVEGSPHVESIEDDRERLADLDDDLADARERRDELADRLDRVERLVDIETEMAEKRTNRETVAELVDEREAMLEAKRDEVEALRVEAGEAETEAERKREAAAEHENEAETCRERIGEHNRRRSDLRDRVDRLERVEDLLEAVSDADAEIDRLRENRDHLAAMNDERRDQLVDLRERRDSLREEFDESRVETARAERDRAEQYLERVEPELERLRGRRDELQGETGAIENELDRLEELRERRDDLAATVERLDSVYEEAEQLESMYGDLRAELRQRNVESLEAMLNEAFALVYRNDSYDRIELSGDYELTVYQKDGQPLDPGQLSGGERALFNLSLRCAIYRLLAEGIEGAAPMPPLILDEPTVFLDSGHVSQLVELVEAMRDYGVEQTLVVSHDEELVAAADDLVRIRKDSRTNRSTVAREEPAERLLEAD